MSADPELVRSVVAQVRRQLVLKKNQLLRHEVHSKEEAEAVVEALSPTEKRWVTLTWDGHEPEEQREL